MPKELLKDLRAKKLSPELLRARGKWPEFALELAEAARKVRVELPVSPGPARPGEFPPAVDRFLADTLRPALSAEESAGLAALEGKWPDYPHRLVALAKEKDLSVPGVTLPGRPSLWRKYYGK